MVTTIRVLKRKDGASLVAGVVLAIITAQFLQTVTGQLTQKLSGVGATLNVVGIGWRVAYLQPIVAYLLEIIALEILVWLYILLHDAVGGK